MIFSIVTNKAKGIQMGAFYAKCARPSSWHVMAFVRASLASRAMYATTRYKLVVGQAFQPDVRLESLTYDECDILAGG